jgi:hypothetical protein
MLLLFLKCRACQGTITALCGKLSGSITHLTPCLKTHMGSTSFAPSCKEALTAAFARKGLKYNLQPELQKACNTDVQRLCPGLGVGQGATKPNSAAAAAAVDKLQRLRSLQQTTGAANADSAETAAGAQDSADGSSSSSSKGSDELVCLSKHLSQLSPGCRQEVAAEVHRELMVYMPGLPLTAACDADATKMCDAGGRSMLLTNLVHVQLGRACKTIYFPLEKAYTARVCLIQHDSGM